MNTNISESMLSSFSTAFAAERANQVAQKARGKDAACPPRRKTKKKRSITP